MSSRYVAIARPVTLRYGLVIDELLLRDIDFPYRTIPPFLVDLIATVSSSDDISVPLYIRYILVGKHTLSIPFKEILSLFIFIFHCLSLLLGLRNSGSISRNIITTLRIQ